jgi:DHA1 family quinolone resistance protein-like MFS transporter
VAKTGASASLVANTLTTWSVVYLLACPVIGRFVTKPNAANLMLASMIGAGAIGLLFIVAPGVIGIYVLMALAGVSAALFFIPFQVFMKAVDGVDNKPIAFSTGMYTFAWSFGFALGPFISGLLMDAGTVLPDGSKTGWKYACYFAALASVAAAAGIYRLKHLAHSQPAAAGQAPAAPAATKYARQPDLAWLGWVGGGAGVILIAIVRAVFPSRSENELHLAQSTLGVVFFLVSLAQALTGLALCRSRYWMYRPSAVAAFGAFGMAGLLALGFGHEPWLLCLGGALFGVYSGSFFFYLVFHALVHPERSSHYVAINEALVGVCSMVGAAAGGWVADVCGFGALYAGGVGLLVLTLAFQGVVHRRHPALGEPG